MEPDALLSRLILDPTNEALCARLGSLDRGRRESLVPALKAELDRQLRAEPERALCLSKTLLELVHDLPHLAVLAERGRAAALHILGRTADALPHYECAVRLHREAGQALEEGKVHRSLVDVYQMLGRTEAALESADRARAIFAAAGDERLLAQLEVNLGNVWFRLDDYSSARRAYLRARAHFALLDDEVSLAFVDFNLAGVETHAHEFEDARLAFESARGALERAGMHVHVADCDYGLAYLRARRGEFARAIAELERARAVYADSTKPSGVPLCDKDLAETYLRLAAWPESSEHAERAVDGFRTLGLDYERAQAQVLRAQARHHLGQDELAIADLEEAGRSFEEIGNALQSRFVLVRRAEWLIASDPERAREILEQACSELSGSEHHLLWNLAELTLAQAMLAVGSPLQALTRLTQLRERRADDSHLDDLIAGRLGQLVAEAHEALGHPERAREELAGSLLRIEATYARVPGRDTRIAFLSECTAAFRHLIRLDAERGTPEGLERALLLLERSRHRSMSEAPRGSRSKSESWLAARARLDALLAQRLDSELGRLTGDAMPAPTHAELDQAMRDFSSSSPLERDARAPAQATKLADLRERLGEQETVIAFFPLRDRFAAFLLDRTRLLSLELDAPFDVIRRLAARLQAQVLRAGSDRDPSSARQAQQLRATRSLLDELGRRLLEPLLPHCPGRELLISPYGLLHQLPFHALRVDGRELVAQRDCGTIPSLSLLTRATTRPTAKKIALVRGADTDLPAVERELAALVARYPDAQLAREPIGDASDFLRQLQARALHVAGHGSFVGEQPLFSGVRIGDTFLTVFDLQALDLPLELVTFSGCQTGRLAEVGGEDYYGLKHALLGAGVRSVVGSEWPVLDEDCAEFMQLLYASLSQGLDVRAAVCRAQRTLAEMRPHPVHWAAFSASGDPRTTLPR